jgi:hypothetical protein
MNPSEPDFIIPSGVYQPIPSWAVPPAGGQSCIGANGELYMRWPKPFPSPDSVTDKRTGKPQVVPAKAQPGKPEPNPAAEPQPESETPSSSYVEFVTPEEQEEYSHGTVSAKQGETPEEYTKRRTRENKAAIFAEIQAKEKAAGQPESRPQAGPVRAMPALAEDALYGMFGRIVRFIEPATEADRGAILVQLLIAFGNIVGRSAYFLVEAAQHYTNLFACLVGRSSKGRKGTSLNHLKQVLKLTDPDWQQERIVHGLSSGEGLIWAVRDPIFRSERDKKTGQVDEVKVDNGVDDKRLLVTETEFAQALKVMSRPTNILSTVIRCAWEDGNLRTLVKNNPAHATSAHISIIGHITEEELKKELSQCELFNGFANRFLWFVVKRARLLPEGGDLPLDGLEQLASELRDVIAKAHDIARVTRDAEARAHWHAIYGDLSQERPGLLGAVTNRAEAQTMRLSLLYALSDGSAKITLAHQEAALALWQYSFESAKYLFGERLSDPRAQRVWDALKARPDGMTRKMIFDEVFQKNISANDFAYVLQSLIETGVARRQMEETGGRNAERWFAI